MDNLNSPKPKCADSSPKKDEGAALILAMIFLVAMAIMVAALADRTRNQTNQITNYSNFEDLLHGIESGVSMARAEINGQRGTNAVDTDGFVGLDPSFDITSENPWFGDTAVTPEQMDSMSGVEYFAYALDWTDDGLDNNGDGTVDELAEEDYYTVYSFARAGASTRRVEVVMEAANINVWTNAIFAGSGQAGNLINGNVSIHGSVHLLGDELEEGDVAVAALDLSGTSLIHNNYDGLSNDLRTRVPTPPTTVVDGETVETLDAKLRVKNGLVGLSGNSEIGQPAQTGNTIKELMDGVYVNDGWTGNGLDADGNPINVYSDNGFDNPYDLGSAIPFPTFADDGGRDHLAYYLETNANVLQGLQHVYDGDMEIEADENFYWNATLGIEVVGGTVGIGLMPTAATLSTLANQFYVWFDATSNRMYINGRIPVDGNIVMDRGSGNDSSISYTGKGSLLAYDANSSGDGGDVAIEVNLRSMNANGTTAGSFPGNNLIGIMAEDDMELGIDSQLEIMGGFYAQDQIILNKQTTIMGTIVGDMFNMGGQVPDIYQVPELVNEWETVMRMIGAETVRFVSPLAWREIGVL